LLQKKIFPEFLQKKLSYLLSHFQLAFLVCRLHPCDLVPELTDFLQQANIFSQKLAIVGALHQVRQKLLAV
jgi:hypothetical protein